MSARNPKLVFLQSIAEQQRRLNQQISSEVKSVINNLQHHPKSHYSISDVEEVVEKLKQKMESINKAAHTEFTKKGLKSPDSLNLPEVSHVSEEFEQLSEEFEQLKVENLTLKEKVSDIEALEMKIDDLQILLDEKETIIAQLKNQSSVDSGKVSTQIEDMNRLQEALDEAQRETKKAIQDREKMEAEFETVGNALMSARLEIEQLQHVLGDKDQEIENLNSEKNIQIENLKSEVKVLGSQYEENRKLKETVVDLQKEIEKQRDDHKLIFEEHEVTLTEQLQSQEKNITQLNQLKEQISKLEQENEDLLLDSGETSQEVIEIRNQLEKTQQSLDQKEEVNRELLLRVEMSEKESQQLSEQLSKTKEEYSQVKQDFEMLTLEITTQKQELGEKFEEAEKIQDKLESSQEIVDDLHRTNRSLEARVKDLEVDLKGKDERIQAIESDRNELRETLASLKIEHEKQKSLLIDLKTQLGTKNRELEENQKDMEILRQRQEEITQQADISRSKQAEITRERDRYENTIKILQTQLDDINADKDRVDKKLKDIKSELKDKDKEISTITGTKKQLEEKSANLMNAVETLRINLAKNPKYAILFVLQDIQHATLTEIAKTVAIQNIFASRLLKELESEGWIKYNEVNGQVTLEKALLELD
ncbi:MAG: hypothetical protein ACXADY_05685 [Candidatus Hodarchaeales archaeon]